MNPEIKKQWVAALRSGEYRQGQGSLCAEGFDGFGYCCLGVLVDTVFDGDWVLDKSLGLKQYVLDMGHGIYDGTLPPELQQAYELSYDEQERLIRMNDIQERSFNEIADYIEKNL